MGQTFASTGPVGHRKRMRSRVARYGPMGLADYEILEMLLFPGVPRRDTKPLAKALINTFGSLSGVLGASPQELQATGVSAASIGLLTLIPDIAQKLGAPEEAERADIGEWSRLLAYCQSNFATVPLGQMRVLFLDVRNQLLADEAVPEYGAGVSASPNGATRLDAPPLALGPAVGALLHRALGHNASALITVRLVDNGVSCAQALQTDTPFVQELLKAAPLLALEVYDHVCLKGKQWLSFRGSGLAEW